MGSRLVELEAIFGDNSNVRPPAIYNSEADTMANTTAVENRQSTMIACQDRKEGHQELIEGVERQLQAAMNMVGSL